MLVAAAIDASPIVRGSPHGVLLAITSAGALVSLAVGLAFRWSAALAAGLAVLGAEQAARLALTSSEVDPWTPVYAAAFLLVAELAWWSTVPRVPAWTEPGTTLRRLGTLGLTCTGGALLAGLVVLDAGAPIEGGLGLEVVGVAAAAGALALVAAASWSRRSQAEDRR